jgi:histone deacetylase complex regulatory component SIN3
MVVDMDAMLKFVGQVQKELGESGWEDYKSVLQKLQQGKASRSDTVDSLSAMFAEHVSLRDQFEAFLPPETSPPSQREFE